LALNEANVTEPFSFSKTRPIKDINFAVLQANTHESTNFWHIKGRLGLLDKLQLRAIPVQTPLVFSTVIIRFNNTPTWGFL
jgi:hypothetical protein